MSRASPATTFRSASRYTLRSSTGWSRPPHCLRFDVGAVLFETLSQKSHNVELGQSLSRTQAGKANTMKKPNIVFAFADDWGRYASAYAKHQRANSLNDLLVTPHFDRVAAEGALFMNAIVPAPSCTPCRSSILAGQYFWQTGLGAILMGAQWDESIPTFPLALEAEAEYFIGCLLYTSPSPRDVEESRMPSSA